MQGNGPWEMLHRFSDGALDGAHVPFDAQRQVVSVCLSVRLLSGVVKGGFASMDVTDDSVPSFQPLVNGSQTLLMEDDAASGCRDTANGISQFVLVIQSEPSKMNQKRFSAL